MGISYHEEDSVRIQGRLVKALYCGHCLSRYGEAHPDRSNNTTESIELGLNAL